MLYVPPALALGTIVFRLQYIYGCVIIRITAIIFLKT